MSTIKKGLPHKSYTKIENVIVSDNSLSDGAFRVYCYFATLPNGKNVNDAYVIKVLNISQRALTNRKKELKEAGLILMDRLAPKVYNMYVGFKNYNASRVKNYWEKQDKGYNGENFNA